MDVALSFVGVVQRNLWVAGNTFRSPIVTGIRWGFLAAFFALTAVGLFSYLRNSRFIAQAELYTAVNIYLLLGLLWAALYLALESWRAKVHNVPLDKEGDSMAACRCRDPTNST